MFLIFILLVFKAEALLWSTILPFGWSIFSFSTFLTYRHINSYKCIATSLYVKFSAKNRWFRQHQMRAMMSSTFYYNDCIEANLIKNLNNFNVFDFLNVLQINFVIIFLMSAFVALYFIVWLLYTHHETCCCCGHRCTDCGVGVGVRCKLQRGATDNSAIRLVVLARCGLRYHVPTQWCLHGIRVKRRTHEAQVVWSGTHSQTSGRVRCLSSSPFPEKFLHFQLQSGEKLRTGKIFFSDFFYITQQHRKWHCAELYPWELKYICCSKTD